MKKKGKVLALLLATAMIGTSYDGSGLVGYAKTTSKAKESEASDSSKQESVVASNGMYTDPTDKEHATGDSKELEERQQKLEKQITSDIKTDDFDNEQSFPAAVDNSMNENAKYFPPIGNQGGNGSCAYWADYYYAELINIINLWGLQHQKVLHFRQDGIISMMNLLRIIRCILE